VNVASQCGYTPQLDGLEALYNKYKDKNVVVLGVPTNDFGGQTPESDEGFKEFI
jgi:glutathione peroxidase